MATRAPLKFCSTPSCPERVTSGHCAKHRKARGAERRLTEDRRYQTQRWRKLSSNRLALYPFCVDCNRLAEVTDHILPVFAFPEKFWDDDNHASRCQGCNQRKGEADRRRYAGRAVGRGPDTGGTRFVVA